METRVILNKEEEFSRGIEHNINFEAKNALFSD